MSFDDDFAADALPALYAQFGTDATVSRGGAAPVAVRVIIDRGQESVGEHGRVYGVMDVAAFQCLQWTPEPGDVLTWSDRFGTHTKTVESVPLDDGLEARAVLHG